MTFSMRLCAHDECRQRAEMAGYCRRHFTLMKNRKEQVDAGAFGVRGRRQRYDDSHPERAQDRARRHNAARRGVPTTPYRSSDIFVRDGWICGLCEQPIAPNLTYPDAWSASIDHVHPIALGGADSPDNVQAAHLACNIAKGAR